MLNVMKMINKKIKLFFAKFLMVFALFIPAQSHADVEWIEDTVMGIFNFFASACDALPNFNSFTTGSISVSLDQTGNDLGVYRQAATGVRQGKMVKVQWNTRGIESRPRKYLVVYRIDPRFSRPQTFILKKNYSTGNYDSDFQLYGSGALANYQTNPDLDFASGARAAKYEDYFNYRGGRNGILVSQGDVINITLTNMPTEPVPLVSAWNNLNTLLTPSQNNLASVHLGSPLVENRIIYSGMANWCAYVSANSGSFIPGVGCGIDSNSGNQVFLNTQNSFQKAYGNVDSITRLSVTPLCAPGTSGPSPAPLCSYNEGRGMNITVGGTEIKSTYAPFYYSEVSHKDFFYYKSSGRGQLDFNTTIPLDNIYANFPRLMTDWLSNPNHQPTYSDTGAYITSLDGQTAMSMNYMHLGRYIMQIDIGNSDDAANFHQQNDIRVTYKVAPSAPVPLPDSGGVEMTTQEHQSNASMDGTLWIKVDSPHDEIEGTINVSYAYYTGSTFLSNLLYDNIALPVMNLMRETASLFYQGIAVNPTWQLMVRILLSFYISMYAIYFLVGKVQVTAHDLFVRVAKLAVVFAMFDSNSWQFFNDRVFGLFLDGMSYLAYSVSGVTSSVGNLFGFVDIIFDKYINPTIWKILFVNLLQFYNGMTFVAILMIEAILTYLMSVIDVVIAYIMAFLTMTVLISLAPMFIVCMLFERTRSMFDNWVSLLFNYMIQPTVLLIFFLLMDKIITNQFNNTAMSVCWGWLIQFNFDLDLSLIGLPLRIRFALPFLPGLPFLVPALAEMVIGLPFVEMDGELTKVVGAVLMFKIYAQISAGLIEYVTNLTAQITNVLPARKKGARQSATNPTTAIADQLKAPIRGAGKIASKAGKQVGNAAMEGWKNPKAHKSKDKMKDFTKAGPDMGADPDALTVKKGKSNSGGSDNGSDA